MPAEAAKASFNGARVGAFETRLNVEMTRLIERNGGAAFVAPSVREVTVSDNKEILAFGEKLKAGKVDVVIFNTGHGARVMFQTLEKAAPMETWTVALGKATLVARGPKPTKALSEAGLKPQITIPEPNTWREILKTLDEKKDVKGLTVAVQEYGDPNRLFMAELAARGAKALSVPVYRPEMPEDTAPLIDLVHKVVAGEIDVLLFTNATQVDHAMAIARKLGIAQDFRRACQRLVVASVGPTCSEALHRHGLPVDVEPPRPVMGMLVTSAAEKSRDLLKAKRSKELEVQVLDAGVARKGDKLHDSLFLKACRREATPRTPIWLMRQAGRYMKEYRELRAKVSFIELCKNSDLAAEVTVDAAHRLGVDAAIIFSDILLIVEPLGFNLSYGKDQGPVISNPFRGRDDLKRLKNVIAEDSMAYVLEAIRKTRRALKPDIPLIGFAGSPFTLASYLIEGGGSKNFVETKKLMFGDPKTWDALLQMITTATIDHVNSQVAAGAQAIQIFDSWVGALSPEDFRVFVLPHTKRLIKNITPGAPAIYFGTQTNGLLPLIRELGAEVVGIDWRIELDEAWEALGKVAIQGNLDPVALFSTPKEIRSRAQRILAQAKGRPGHIFNLGHGILPETPIDNVLALVEAVKEGLKG